MQRMAVWGNRMTYVLSDMTEPLNEHRALTLELLVQSILMF